MPTPMEPMEKRVEHLERRLAELEGAVGFIVPTMREVHRVMIAFRDDARLDLIENRIERLDGKVDSLPRAMAETVSESERRLGRNREATEVMV
jgi:hypothetical protein